jgi:hypothetical protein
MRRRSWPLELPVARRSVLFLARIKHERTGMAQPDQGEIDEENASVVYVIAAEADTSATG